MKSLEEVKKAVEALGWWYQHFQLPNGVVTGSGASPGYNAAERWNYIDAFVPRDLSGKQVLDIGGNAGYFSIQMKLRGAQRCVLVDPFVQALRQAQVAAEQFKVELELVNEDAHTYCLTREDRFDYVIFLGLFYHLKYPGIVLDRRAEMTRERIFIHSHIIGKGPSTYRVQPNYERSKDDDLLQDPAFPKLMFIENEYNHDKTNWWMPNESGLLAMVRSSGLKIIDRPHRQILVAEPEIYFGKQTFHKLVFPKYGKKEGGVFPGPQEIDPAALTEQSRILERGQRAGWRNRIPASLLKYFKTVWFLWVHLRGRVINRLQQKKQANHRTIL